MTTEEAKTILSFAKQADKIKLENYLFDIVLRDSLPQLQTTPQDVIIEKLKEIDKEKDEIFNYLQNALPKNAVEEHERELAEQRFLQLQIKALIQFAEYDKLKPKNTAKPT